MNNSIFYSVSDLSKITGFSKVYLYGMQRKIVGYCNLKETDNPQKKHGIPRFRKADIDFCIQVGKPIIRTKT